MFCNNIMKPFYKIIFCIYGCDTIQKYKDEIIKIQETWASNISHKVLFFLGEEIGQLSGDEYIHLENVGNDYLSAADKQNGGIKYIYDNYDFKYMYICGTDTYVFIKNLETFIEHEEETNQIDSEKPLIIGGHGDNRKICDNHVHYFSGGAGFLLTKKAVSVIYPEIKNIQEEWMGLCVANNYITWIPSCDLSLCYYLKKMGIIFINVHNRFFSCNHLGYINEYKCCAETIDFNTIVSCHNMKSWDFDYIYGIYR